MVEGDDGVRIGEPSLPKGTKILKSTVSTTSGGDNKWSAVRYRSTLNLSASHDFGEFTDNLIPNGSFDEGKVKWTPTNAITAHNDANSSPNVGRVATSESVISDTFVNPPSKTFTTDGIPLECSVKLTNNDSPAAILFDSLSLVSP